MHPDGRAGHGANRHHADNRLLRALTECRGVLVVHSSFIRWILAPWAAALFAASLAACAQIIGADEPTPMATGSGANGSGGGASSSSSSSGGQGGAGVEAC